MSVRIYQLAKKLGIDTKKLIEILKKYNVSVKSHMSVLDKETAQIVEHEVEDYLKKEKEEEKRKWLESLKRIEIEFPITVRDFAVKIDTKVSQLLSALLKKGKMLNINQQIDLETAKEIGMEFGFLVEEKKKEEEKLLEVSLKEENLRKRAPVVTLMGHIDHGKTSLLDRIRRSRITEKEAGGITQHIGAYQVKTSHGEITFIDTPGHQTFTMMRARGAQVTDIVVLVVAADEGVKPQTEEAISHARQANVPIIVAINKIDKPEADVDNVKSQLSKLNLVPEDWGGDTICVKVSAKTGEGIEELLEMIILQAEMMDLKADFSRPAIGVVIESRLSKEKGPLATFLIQHGILRTSNIVIAGNTWGKIRAMWDDRGNLLKEALPSFPVEVLGLEDLPTAGDKFFVVPDEEKAKEIIKRKKEERKQRMPSSVRLEDVFKKIKEKELKELKIILKTDTSGTAEAIEDALNKVSSNEVKINIIHKGVGIINTSDILLAEASGAVVIGFNVKIDPQAREEARTKKIDVRTYQVIYQLLDEITQAVQGLLEPTVKKVFVGRAVVRKVFKLSRAGVVAGCFVEKGVIRRGLDAELVRGKEVVFRGKILSLKRFKDDVREVQEGYECGISLGFSDIQEQDYIDVYTQEIEK